MSRYNTINFEKHKIIKAFDKCMESIKCVESQDGGSNLVYKILYYENKLQKLYDIILISEL